MLTQEESQDLLRLIAELIVTLKHDPQVRTPLPSKAGNAVLEYVYELTQPSTRH